MSLTRSIISLALLLVLSGMLRPSSFLQGPYPPFAEAAQKVTTKSDDGNDNTTKEVPLYKQREPECFDRSPHCPQWRSALECRKSNGKSYMNENCRSSCNLCNPLLQPWVPGDTTYENHATFSTMEDIGFQIKVGVEQKVDFSDSPMHKYGFGKKHPALSENKYIKARVTSILESQKHYLDRYYSDVEVNGGVRISSINPDSEQIINDEIDTVLPLTETCLNYHPYCANWAARGMCELKPSAMADVCAAVCHSKYDG